MSTHAPDRVVVVGHGMVGHRFAEALTSRDVTRACRVTVLSEEPRPAYDRVALPSVFDGADEATLRLPPLRCRPAARRQRDSD
jgi:nitrite reductase (NADH) large subunit